MKPDVDGAPARADTVSAVLKAVGILEFLSTGVPHYALHEIASELHLNKTTAHRLLQTLASVGWVEQSDDGRYGLGAAILPIGLSVQRRMGLREMARPLMEELVAQHGGACVLLVPSAAGAVCVESVEAMGPTKLNVVRLGAVLPFHTSAGPRVLAAYSPKVREDLVSSALVRYTAKTITDLDQLHARLEEIRQRGYELADGDVIEGIAAVAVPIHDADGRTIAAVGFGDTSPNLADVQQMKLVEAMVEMGRNLSSQLGSPIPRTGEVDARGVSL